MRDLFDGNGVGGVWLMDLGTFLTGVEFLLSENGSQWASVVLNCGLFALTTL